MVNWILGDGSISGLQEKKERSYYEVSFEKIKDILNTAVNQFSHESNISSEDIVDEGNEVIKVNIKDVNNNEESIVFTIKNITPGGSGRSDDEFRIQQKPIVWKKAHDYAIENDMKSVILGVYKTVDSTEPIFCTWKSIKLEEVKSSPQSKQIKNIAISEAITKGFTQYKKKKGEIACAFRKEFLFFYLENLDWLHDSLINEVDEVVEEIDNEINEVVSNINGINRIYFGAPGTGKSYGIQKFIKENGLKDYTEEFSHPNVFRTTLHPDYAYNDFTGQVMPIVQDEQIEYKYSPQIFTNALKRAFDVRKNNEPVFLILEEMSRANVASVFGDLFQLLDRNEKGISEYSINNALIAQNIFDNPNKKIFIPENLFILGTVNTSDQNVYVMDTAFKRRFEFEYVPTSTIVKDKNNYKFSLTLDDENEQNLEIHWSDLVMKLNELIVTPEEYDGLGLTEDKQIGQFFIKFKESKEGEISKIEEYNYNQIKGKLLQYLWHDIENISYSSNKIFSEEIKSFSELYNLANKRKNFFSNTFLEKIKRVKS